MQRRRSQVHTHHACRLRRCIAVLDRDKAQKSPIKQQQAGTRGISGFQVKYAHEADVNAYYKEAGNLILGTFIEDDSVHGVLFGANGFKEVLHIRSVMRQRKEETTQIKKTSGSSNLFATKPDDFSELVWENGQLVMQKQCNWRRKSSFPSSFSTQSGRVKEKDTEGSFGSKPAKISGVDSVVDDFTFPRYFACGSSARTDASVPLIKDPTDEGLASEALEHVCCAGIWKSLQFDAVPSSVHKTCTELCPRACSDEAIGVLSNAKHEHVLKASIGGSELGIIDSSQLFKSKVLSPESKVLNVSIDSSNIAQHEHCKDVVDERVQNQRLLNSKKQLSNNPKSLLNFSHFARPVSLAKVALRKLSRLTSLREYPNLPNENPVIPTPAGRKPVLSPHKMDLGPNLMTPKETGSVQQCNEIGFQDALRKNNNPKSWGKLSDDVSESKFAASMALNRNEIGVGCEAVVAPSICSGNFVEEASYAPKACEKRKEPRGEEYEYKNEDLQDLPASIRRLGRAKRSLASDVRKLSEKKRRKRINKKIDALQELIPNCDKVDTASILEEAIDYVKTLQLQVQIMSMARELYMHTMVLPPVTVARLPPPVVGMSTAIELGIGMGAYDMNRSMAGIPQIIPPQFPCTPTSYQTGLFSNPGPVSIQMNGVPLPRMPPFSAPGEMLGTTSDPAHPNATTEVSGDH